MSCTFVFSKKSQKKVVTPLFLNTSTVCVLMFSHNALYINVQISGLALLERVCEEESDDRKYKAALPVFFRRRDAFQDSTNPSSS